MKLCKAMAGRTVEVDLGQAVAGGGPGDGEVVPAAVALDDLGRLAVVEGCGAALFDGILHDSGSHGCHGL